MLLKVLLAGSDELDGSELEAAVLEALDDGTDEATLRGTVSRAAATTSCWSAAIEQRALLAHETLLSFVPGRRRA